MFELYIFYFFAALMLFSATMVITVRNPVHAALFLVVAFFASATVWLLMQAEFLAIILILVYVGAVMVLFLFGTMLTRARIGVETDLNNKNWFMGVPVAVLLFATLAIALNDGFGDQRLPSDSPVVSTQQLSDQIFGPYLLPFWALSFVLLAAVIGAIVLSRRD